MLIHSLYTIESDHIKDIDTCNEKLTDYEEKMAKACVVRNSASPYYGTPSLIMVPSPYYGTPPPIMVPSPYYGTPSLIIVSLPFVPAVIMCW